jgi:phosphate transport system substrate-binding protein
VTHHSPLHLSTPVRLLMLPLIAVLCVIVGCSGTSTTPLNGHLTIDGSTALQPLATKAAQLFMQLHPNVTIDVNGGGSLTGLADVNAGKVDIGDSDVYASPEQYPNPNLTDHLVAVVPFTMIVNPDVVGVTSLTTDQIIKIYSTREYTNWDQVGGPNLPIVRVVRPATSGTRATFRKYVLGGLDENESGAQLLKSDSSTLVRATVAQTNGAIGYVGVSYVSPTGQTPPLPVLPISINGVAATASAIENGTYAYWGYEHMYTQDDSPPLLAAFLAFMGSPTIQQIASQLLYIPIADMHLPASASASSSASAYGDDQKGIR